MKSLIRSEDLGALEHLDGESEIQEALNLYQESLGEDCSLLAGFDRIDFELHNSNEVLMKQDEIFPHFTSSLYDQNSDLFIELENEIMESKNEITESKRLIQETEEERPVRFGIRRYTNILDRIDNVDWEC